MCLTPCQGPSGRADRPGRPWVYRVFVGPAGTLVPTGANGVRERLGGGGWRLGTRARQTGPTAWGLASSRVAMMCLTPCQGPSGRADRPGRPWVYRVFVGPAGTLVPTGANGVRERLGGGGWRLGTRARQTGPTAWGLASSRVAMMCLTPCQGPSGRADRPGRPWVYRVFVGPAGTLVPTWSGETIRVRDRVSFQGKERPD